MDDAAPIGGARRGPRRWKRWLIVPALLPFIAFGLSNLALGSPWSRHWIASKIKARTTLDTRIDGASWSPWNGATFRGIRLEQPQALRATAAEPLIHIPELQIYPVWKTWLKGRPEIKAIKLTSPRVVLPLEIISHFSATAPAPPAPSSEAKAAPPEPALPGEISPAPSAVVESPAPAPPPPVAKGVPTDFIHLIDASFALVLGGRTTPLMETLGIGGSIPVAGDPAESSLTISTVRVAGKAMLENVRIPLRWQAPVITAAPAETRIAGLNAKFAGQLALASGLPLRVEAVAPKQAMETFPLGGKNTLGTAGVSANTRFAGLLLAPASWHADFVTAAVAPVVHFNGGDQKFEHAQAIAVLRGGTLSCIDARLIGDDLSFLGNATLLSNGNAAAVLRVVAPPETTTSIIGRIFPGIEAAPSFTALSTPQRVALDLEAIGRIGDFQFRLGRNGPIIGATAPATVPPR